MRLLQTARILPSGNAPGASVARGGKAVGAGLFECMRVACEMVERVRDEVLWSQFLHPDNVAAAWDRVRRNRGSAGVDGVTVAHLAGDRFGVEWRRTRHGLLHGSYEPRPVLRCPVRKTGGGMRWLGIPTVIDRVILQAMAQALMRHWEPTFSRRSFGYRPGRSARQAVGVARREIQSGKSWVVDLDIEKFFDSVDHDLLIGRLVGRAEDGRFLALVRRYLRCDGIEEGRPRTTDKGLAQGSPLSPLLANVVLDELDQALEGRRVAFARYADDCLLFSPGEEEGRALLNWCGEFLLRRMGLRLHDTKSRVTLAQGAAFLGFRFLPGEDGRVRLAPTDEAVIACLGQLEDLTRFRMGVGFERMRADVARFWEGWRRYYRGTHLDSVDRLVEERLQRHFRAFMWTMWGDDKTRLGQLLRRGADADMARHLVRCQPTAAAAAIHPVVCRAITLEELRLPACREAAEDDEFSSRLKRACRGAAGYGIPLPRARDGVSRPPGRYAGTLAALLATVAGCFWLWSGWRRGRA